MAKLQRMDYTKIQTEVMKDSAENGRNKYHFGTYDSATYGTLHAITEGHVIVFVPDCFYYLDDVKVFGDKPAWRGVETFVNSASEAEPIVLTPELRTIPAAKKPLLVFVNEQKEKIYIDSRLHDYFKNAPGLLYRGTNAKTPIYIYSCDQLIGCILPVMVKETD